MSLPSWEIFDEQPEEYRDSVLTAQDRGPGLDRSSLYFRLGQVRRAQDTVLGTRSFGLSAPIKVVAEHFGFEPDHIVSAAQEQVAAVRRPS